MPELKVWATPRGDAWQLIVSLRQPTDHQVPGVTSYSEQPIGSPMTALQALRALRSITSRVCR